MRDSAHTGKPSFNKQHSCFMPGITPPQHTCLPRSHQQPLVLLHSCTTTRAEGLEKDQEAADARATHMCDASECCFTTSSLAPAHFASCTTHTFLMVSLTVPVAAAAAAGAFLTTAFLVLLAAATGADTATLAVLLLTFLAVPLVTFLVLLLTFLVLLGAAEAAAAGAAAAAGEAGLALPCEWRTKINKSSSTV
jgi:hypothetical protein